jgi:serine protease Do
MAQKGSFMNKAFFRVLMVVPLLAALAGGQETPPAPPKAPKAPARPRVMVRTQVAEAAEPPEVFRWQGGGAYLGVDTRDVTSERLGALKLKEERGVEIVMVDKDAPAGKAGLKEHDVILSFNGEKVESVAQLRRMIRETPPGRTVELGISRDGKPMSVKTELADRHKIYMMHEGEWPRVDIPDLNISIPDIDIPSFQMLQYSRRNGILVENLTSQLGDYFGVKNGEGVLVRSVEKGSRGEAAGFKAGDVIVRVGNERVTDMGDWNRFTRRAKGGSVTVTVIRDRKERTLSLTLPESKAGDSSGMHLSTPEIHVEMETLRRQLERMRPEMRASAEVAQREMERVRREMERVQRELRRSLEED